MERLIHDCKGITEKVEIVGADKHAVMLNNWEVYNIPVDYQFAKQKNMLQILLTAPPIIRQPLLCKMSEIHLLI